MGRLMDNADCTNLGNQPTCDSKDLKGEEEQFEHSHHNEEAIEEVILGKEFLDVNSAKKYYMNYGGKNGFNVKIRNSRKNSEDFVTWVHYACSKEGFRDVKRHTNASYSQPVSRCGWAFVCLVSDNWLFGV
uniref:uncharacterized protein LOC105350414 n=1 Tax=Fragaria vesca subsp. vesca TaxID=101020 RepID=UPI0005CA922F|nr:PREDICTED: uncharacterized protein LOC105350414 [Fragaria vesca subsp. vesca]